MRLYQLVCMGYTVLHKRNKICSRRVYKRREQARASIAAFESLCAMKINDHDIQHLETIEYTDIVELILVV